jgi:hypothetical protein
MSRAWGSCELRGTRQRVGRGLRRLQCPIPRLWCVWHWDTGRQACAWLGRAGRWRWPPRAARRGRRGPPPARRATSHLPWMATSSSRAVTRSRGGQLGAAWASSCAARAQLAAEATPSCTTKGSSSSRASCSRAWEGVGGGGAQGGRLEEGARGTQSAASGGKAPPTWPTWPAGDCSSGSRRLSASSATAGASRARPTAAESASASGSAACGSPRSAAWAHWHAAVRTRSSTRAGDDCRERRVSDHLLRRRLVRTAASENCGR